METKICRICGEEMPISDFPKHRQYKGGHDTRCKCCTNAYTKANRAKRKGGGGNPKLADITPRELIEELKYRGYTGTLSIVREIKL